MKVVKDLDEKEIRALTRDTQRNSFLTDFRVIRFLHVHCVENTSYTLDEIENVQLDLILKVLKVDFFLAKMCALTEINNSMELAYPYTGVNVAVSKDKLLRWLRENRVSAELKFI